MNHVSASGARREDMIDEMYRYPLADDELWKDKRADCSKIKIPVYVVASYSNTLHTMGTFRAWREIGSQEKWLRIHDSQEWPDYYNKENTEERRRFFDHYLQGKDNGWENMPRVRYVLLDLEGNNRLELPAEEFPAKGTEYRKYYMNGKSRTLQAVAETDETTIRYSVDGLPVRTSFQMTFDKETSFLGYPKVKLFVQAEGYNDMDLFVWVQKIDRRGNVLSEFVVPNHGAALQDFTQDGASTLRYKGPHGKLRVSMRHLNEQKSTDIIPVYTFDRVEKLSEGEIAEVDIILSPIGMTWYEGETLRVMVSTKDEIGSIMPGTPGCIPDNKGTHVLHTGGCHASYLQLPLLTK